MERERCSLTIELGGAVVREHCARCGRPLCFLYGFLYRACDPWITYDALVPQRRDDRWMQVLVCQDAGTDAEEWRPGASIALTTWVHDAIVKSSVLEPSDSPWNFDNPSLGTPVSQADVLAWHALDELWDAVDFIYRTDPAIARFLGPRGRGRAVRHRWAPREERRP
jgi:hypothetical protein